MAAAVGLAITSALPAGADPVAAGTPLKAVLSLSRTTSAIGQKVTASARRSTKPTGDTLKRITVSWGNGTAAVRLSSLRTRPTHRYRHAGRFVVRLRLVDEHGNVAHDAAVEHVYAASGSYSGVSPTGLHFYVSSSGNTVQDVSFPTQLRCSNGNLVDDELIIPGTAISTSGSFSAARTSTGILSGQTVRDGYRFSGHFGWSRSGGRTAAGRLRETIAFHGISVTCTTGTEAWTAQRDVQPRQTNAAPLAGSYSGTSPTGLRFYVSFSRGIIQDVSFPTQLFCSNNSLVDDELSIPSAKISRARAFGATGKSTGVLSGQKVTYRYGFRGNFHGIGESGAVRAAGTLRETITFGGSGVTCTTDDEAWTAERDVQPRQTNTAPLAGSYAGVSPTGLRFYVSSSRKKIQDVSFPTQLFCSDNSLLDDELIIPSAKISLARAFGATGTDTGILRGQSVDYRYSFRGNFHGIGQSGAVRAAGTLRETITFGGSGVICATDDKAWAAEREVQPTQSGGAPPRGSYAGVSPTGLTFKVASATELQNVSFPTQLQCSDNSLLDDQLSIAGEAITSSGAFAKTVTATGSIGGHPVDYTYTFRGNFHGVGQSGAERAAGAMRESITFTDSSRTCTTNTEAWSAQKSA